LAIEVSRHQALTQQFDTVHLGFDAASAVVAAPFSPERSTEVFRCPQGFVARNCTCGDGLPRLGILARRDDSVGSAFGYGIVALARVVGPVGGDTGDLLVGRDLDEQLGQHRGIAHIAACDFNSPNLQCFFVDPEMDLAPDAAFCPAMLARVPLAFSLDLDPRAVRCPAGYCAAMPERGSAGAADPVSPDAECSRQGSSGDG
jgi:hypothetical protein